MTAWCVYLYHRSSPPTVLKTCLLLSATCSATSQTLVKDRLLTNSSTPRQIIDGRSRFNIYSQRITRGWSQNKQSTKCGRPTARHRWHSWPCRSSPSVLCFVCWNTGVSLAPRKCLNNHIVTFCSNLFTWHFSSVTLLFKGRDKRTHPWKKEKKKGQCVIHV